MEITNSSAQTVNMGSNVIFTNTAVSGCPSIIFREGSGLIKLRGLTTTQSRARFRASFGANIAIPTGGTVGEISLVLSIDGEPVESTRMIVTPAATANFFNISSDIYLDVPAGCCATLGVKNTEGPAITVQNANLIVERVA